ncbi:DUF2345 domain-containing protein, partial [Klebsiella pneumoniae subsp. pneumoniae]|uniref:DUF2345 domain-containing protein n=1 Tax=Klebsiella pneumoniae TaxID=573 RepID=UPI003CFA9233
PLLIWWTPLCRMLQIMTRRFTLYAYEKALGLFVHKEGAKLVANQGNIEIQAQHNTMSLFSEKQLTVTSSEDEIIDLPPELDTTFS